MYFVKNALKSISRSKGRNVLIGIIILVIAASSCVALSIRNSANEIVNNQRESFDITATLGVDRNALRNDLQSSGGTDIRTLMDSIPALTVDQLKNFANSQYVKSLTYSMNTSMNSSTITAVSNTPANTNSSTSTNENSKNAGNRAPNGDFGGQAQGDFRVVGYSSTSAMTNFIDGTNKITSGTMFSDSDTANDCVITDELAKANNLTVGSKITLTNPQDSTQAYDFTVVGIYTDTSTGDGSQMNLFSNSANQIITDFSAVNAVVTASNANSNTALTSQINSSFHLKNADNLDAFKSELTAKGLNKYYTVSSNIDSFNTSVAPLSNLSHFATIFLILVLVIGSIVLFVLNMINIRERKYEIGVLRAIGMKKGKVVFQFITELFIVTFLAIGIGSGIGAAASVPTANYMLQNEIGSIQSQQSQVQQNFGRQGGGQMGQRGGMGGFFGGRQNVSYINQINAVIDVKVLAEIAGIGILLVVISSGMSMIFISRYEPLKILSSRA